MVSGRNDTAVSTTAHGAVQVITLNRPHHRNAIDTAMCGELIRALEQTGSDEGIRAVLLQGAGQAFCAGGDIRDMPLQQRYDSALRHTAVYQTAAKLLYDMPKPVVCAVNGAAAGAGFSLALACDVILAGESASFLPAVGQVGLVPDCGSTFLLARSVGRHRAKELIFSGRSLSAAEAQQYGIVSQVVPDEQLEQAALSLAERFAQGPTLAMALAKSAIDRSFTLTAEQALELETHSQCRCFLSEDYLSGKAAFMQHTVPVFEGK